MRYLKHNSYAVSGFAFGGLSGAVLQLFYDFKGVVNDLVRLPSFDAYDSSDTAVVVFKLCFVKSLVIFHIFFTHNMQPLTDF